MQEHWGSIIAALTSILGDLQIAEDVLQESLVKALEIWPKQGVPKKPAAWLYATAKNKAIDQFRRSRSFRDKASKLSLQLLEDQSEIGEDDYEIPEERLRLIFTCCHPSLARESQVALTLKTLAGLSTKAIAQVFLVSESSMAQRIVRAKKKIREAGVPYAVPQQSQWQDRLESVLEVIYFIFNEGYGTVDLQDRGADSLSQEAIRLGDVLSKLIPNEPEILGLQALMLLHDSRKQARRDASGQAISLENQDRSVWNQSKIRRGDSLLRKALIMGKVGPYQIQAAISAIHSTSDSFESTDWQQILLLYERLYKLQPTPVIRLNSIVAMSFAESPQAALEALIKLEHDPMTSYQPYFAAKADLLRRTGDLKAAAQAYDEAIKLCSSSADIKYLETMKQSLMI